MGTSRLIAIMVVILAGGVGTQAEVHRSIHLTAPVVERTETRALDSVTVECRLYAAPTGGSALWAEIQVVPVDRGRYAVWLGTVNPLPDDVHRSTRLWLEYTVDGQGSPGRIPLAPDRYAYGEAPSRAAIICMRRSSG